MLCTVFAELVAPTEIVAPQKHDFFQRGEYKKIGGGGRNKGPLTLSFEKLVTLGYYFGKYGICKYA